MSLISVFNLVINCSVILHGKKKKMYLVKSGVKLKQEKEYVLFFGEFSSAKCKSSTVFRAVYKARG